MRRNLLAVVLSLAALSTGMAADPIVKDDFEAQTEGQQLSDLTNWKFIAGWIKPEFGKVTVENGNKFLRIHGDIFSRNPSNLEEKLTYRFKIRATGSDDELGGLCLRAPDGKSRYDVLFTYRHEGGVQLVQDTTGTRDQLAKAEGLKNNVFQAVVVTIERVANGVKFVVTVDGTTMIDKLDTHAMSLLNDTFTAGFFTYNQKTIDIDDVEFTRGR